ncbi:MAG: BPSS1780 family membrane protein [Pseudomonadota bacterium]
MDDNNNPYQAPSANIERPLSGGDVTLLDQPRKLPAGRGWGWIAEGFGFFKRSPVGWILGLILGGLGILLLMFIPLIGPILYMLSFYVVIGGIMLGCHAQSQGQPFEVRYLLAAFSNPVKLILLAVVVLIATIVIMGVTLGPTFVSMMTSPLGSESETAAANALLGDPTGFMLKTLIGSLISIPLAMAIWFAPALITLHDVGLVDALKRSFAGCLKNMLPFLVFGVIGLVLYFLAILPIGLGLLIFLPTFTAATYVAYRDIFTESA